MCPIDHTATSSDDSSVKSQHALERVCTTKHAQIWQLDAARDAEADGRRRRARRVVGLVVVPAQVLRAGLKRRGGGAGEGEGEGRGEGAAPGR